MSWGWIGVDLDGTLAHYTGWLGDTHIGAPIEAMVARVKQWRSEGKDVRIFTARVGDQGKPNWDGAIIVCAIEAWCEAHLGEKLPVTNCKDFGMIELWDDRCVQVEANTGKTMREVWEARRDYGEQ